MANYKMMTSILLADRQNKLLGEVVLKYYCPCIECSHDAFYISENIVLGVGQIIHSEHFYCLSGNNKLYQCKDGDKLFCQHCGTVVSLNLAIDSVKILPFNILVKKNGDFHHIKKVRN